MDNATPKLSRVYRTPVADLAIPDITADLNQRMGASVIDEFVLGHVAADVFRELVQNEFDADGYKIGIRLAESQLEVTGSGKAIPAKGWARLSVLIGTGEVLGDNSGETVTPKENSIGSKNLGMRSLFRFGDRIHVRSNGQMAVLDLRKFEVGRQADPVTRGRDGILIQVPYRTETLRKFPPYTDARELSDLDEIERLLFPTLVKLATTGRRKGVRELSITSERTGRRLDWRQEIAAERSKVAGVALVRRSGRLQTRDAQGVRSRRNHQELEFSRLVDIPAEHEDRNFPAYYRQGNQVRVAVSVALKSKKPITDRMGFCYYPLQAAQSQTGCAVSVSAPFELDADRSRNIEGDWNTWLNNQAADLVADLVGSDWLGRFGPAAYDLTRQQGSEKQAFAALVLDRLKTRPCWPNALGEYGLASATIVPSYPALYGHVAEKNYLHQDLAADPEIAALAVTCGARRFTIASLIRLRCGGEKAEGLHTKLPNGDASFRYVDDLARDPDRQHRSASALTQLSKHLSTQNRRDVRATSSTLSATGELRPAETLILVSPDMWETCPELLSSRLHPILRDDTVVSRHCQPFDLARWIEQAASRAAEGTGTDAEREALYQHLIKPETKLSSRLLGIVRRSPVIKDTTGGWARPDGVALLSARDARLVSRVVSAPAPEVARRADLIERLSIRRKITWEDLVALAKVVETEPTMADAFEDLLRRHQKLITPRVVRALSNIAFLRSRAGGLAAPGRLHLPSGINLSLLADTELLLDEREIYRHLGCPTRPDAAVLVEVLERARYAGLTPPVPSLLYPALADALRADRPSIVALTDAPVLFVDDTYVTPHATLVSSRPARCLQAAIPVMRGGGAMAEAYLTLGASPAPRSHHWVAFFEWIDRQASAAKGKVSITQRDLVRDAYRHLATFGLPLHLASDTLCLLSNQDTVHSLDELASGHFLENDYPELADALTKAKADIAFADRDEASRIIFRQKGIQALSARCGDGRVQLGSPATAPGWFQEKVQRKAMEQLQRPDLAQGVAALAADHQKQARDFQPARASLVRRRMQTIGRIEFSSGLQRTYQIGCKVMVPVDGAIEGGVFYLRPPRFASEYHHVLALELARLAGATRLADIRALASSMLPLLSLDRPAEVLAYLRRQGLSPDYREFADDQPDVEETELTRQQIGQDLMATLRIAQPSPITPPPVTASRPPSSPAVTPTSSPAPPLPSLDDVRLSVTIPTGSAPPTSNSAGGGGGWRTSTTFTPRSPAQIERDREVGQRGEALIYKQELDRVRTLGFDPPSDHVTWVSKDNPGADHDIRSVDAHGGAIWIEVKSTTGSDGTFDWSIAEFERALSEGPRYQLWRVYDVAGAAPVAKCFANPASLLKTPMMRLEISSLRAFVEGRW
ncbi:DUF3883 domain-containing protein [Rhizobium leguminosarum]|uniref:DUF3883 domain-containing protein n=1 Tax=Rhizobium leguminosarum TaxID=384 RepID=UPI0010308CA5|nr:DUF3883 domain-containing protein [Rhizobium leguminosarum]TAU85684.1 DUF3883 domain-containing protein [Rhizobium leguminosarum]TAX11552.1 DUF3883 domain-containing protein [Rhizobium leguminosarum]TAY14441.1 DUF3883 domain-containing protein [Rhizobium leguminosarum]TAZ16494.1 DUF3883 domain-containing protein [Rhizobium leguminosarum]